MPFRERLAQVVCPSLIDVRGSHVLPGAGYQALQGHFKWNVSATHVGRSTILLPLHFKFQHIGSTGIEVAGIRLELEPHRLARPGDVDRLDQVQWLGGVRQATTAGAKGRSHRGD